MLRDSLKNEEYFQSYIKYEESRIQRFSEALKTLEGKDSVRETECRRYLSGFLKNKLSAMYSAGYCKEDIKEVVTQYLAYLNETGMSSFSDYVDALSFVILFDIPIEKEGYILKEISYDEDSLVQGLKEYIQTKETHFGDGKLLFPAQYQVFFKYICGVIDDSVFADFMKNQWYSLNEGMSWYNSHLSKNDTYNGYWSWLGAALIKIAQGNKAEYTCSQNVPVELI